MGDMHLHHEKAYTQKLSIGICTVYFRRILAYMVTHQKSTIGNLNTLSLYDGCSFELDSLQSK